MSIFTYFYPASFVLFRYSIALVSCLYYSAVGSWLPVSIIWTGAHMTGLLHAPMYCVEALALANCFGFSAVISHSVFSICLIIYAPASKSMLIKLKDVGVPLIIRLCLHMNWVDVNSSISKNAGIPNPKLPSTCNTISHVNLPLTWLYSTQG